MDPRLEQKMAAAKAALNFVNEDTRLGVGAGFTVDCFIKLLAASGRRVETLTAASARTARQLETAGFACLEESLELDVYVDGADEIDDNRQMIKGGGGAHAREKIMACCARRFICIVDEGKFVSRLGRFPLPVEVLPIARSYVARQLVGLGGSPCWREGFVTDNGNWILDVSGLDLTDTAAMEKNINAIAGVVENGIFSRRRADVVIIGTADGTRIIGA